MSSASTQSSVEHLDILIVGAGISGIGAGHHLRTALPAKRIAILEARGTLGGTWDLFRYPGIRSDSDLHTFGYKFKPWRDQEAIADAPRILRYLDETVAESGLEPYIRYHHRVSKASWSSDSMHWDVVVDRADTGEQVRLTADWLFCAAGYYRYDEGYTPQFKHRDRFSGIIVHPQHWPADLDCTGKRVLVIGSGATAVTLLPAIAVTAAHVVMLQRTPTYLMPVPRKDAIGNALKKYLGETRGYALTRRKNIARQQLMLKFCQAYPKAARRLIRWINARSLPSGYPVDEHFNPPYDPWQQRLCAVPDGDLFRAICEGKASIVTDRIAFFTENGVSLESGRELKADIIVTATGLSVQPFGGIPLDVDGVAVHLPNTVAYKGMMLSDVPNLAYAVGYTNSSWTLKVDLVCEHVCRLLSYMDAHGYRVCQPRVSDPAMQTRPLLDFAAGYIQRAAADLPRQGDRSPWLTSANYYADVKLLRSGSVTDRELHFATTGNR